MRERLLRDERDYRRSLDRLEEAVGDFGVRLYLFRLMSGRAQKRKTYRCFVESGLAEGDEELREALQAPGLALGEEFFRQWVEKLRAKALPGGRVEQDVSFRRIMQPLPASQVIEEVTRAFGVNPEMLQVTRKESPLRAVAAGFLVSYAGQTQTQQEMVTPRNSIYETPELSSDVAGPPFGVALCSVALPDRACTWQHPRQGNVDKAIHCDCMMRDGKMPRRRGCLDRNKPLSRPTVGCDSVESGPFPAPFP